MMWRDRRVSLCGVLLMVVLMSPAAQAATYYLATTGSNSNNGTASGTPWLTFAFAINAARAWCGDTLVLLDGAYGDGATTGKISLSNVSCAAGDELVITAQSQRKAKIVDSGSGYAIRIVGSQYIVVDGLYALSADVNGISNAGRPFSVSTSNHITIRNTVGRNPNRYANSHVYDILNSQDILLEDNEAYVFHRHCVTAWQSERVVVRRQYCNPRGGRISGGFNAAAGIGSADSLMSMYPCKDCLLENSIADGTTSPMYLSEMNATFGSSVLMSGSKVVGSICYKCNYGNAVYPNSRTTADLNHTPQNIVIRDVAVVDFASSSNGIRCSDCVNTTIDHVTILGTGVGTHGIFGDDTASGSAPSTSSLTITNTLVSGMAGTGFRIASGAYATWSGDELFSTSNGTDFFPALPTNWTNTSTAAHGMGSCKVWVPSGAATKGAGQGGSDIGATILYRYVDGVLTTIPLWDPTTGEFPHGNDDFDGTNTVAGQSLKDFHLRVNVDTNGCAFPAGYGSAGPEDPNTYQSGTGTTSATWGHTIDPGTQGVLVGVALLGTGSTVGTVSSVTGCSGENIPAISGATIATVSGARRMSVFGKLSPTSGACTMTVSTTGTVEAVAAVSIAIPTIGSFGNAVVATPTDATATPSVTAVVNADHTVLDFLSAKCVPVSNVCTTTLSIGPDQTLKKDVAHPTKDVRVSTSTQSGAAGGHMSATMGGSNFWAYVAVPVIPPSPGGGSGSTFRIRHYRAYTLHGSSSAPEVSIRPLANLDTPAGITTLGAFRMRAEILVETASSTETGVAYYCRRNADAFTPVTNAFGTKTFRFIGPGSESTIPATLTKTTSRLSSTPTFVPGWVVRDGSLPIVLPPMGANTRTELDAALVVGNGFAVNDTLECEWRRDGGGTLGTHTVTPTILGIRPRAIQGF